MGNEREKQIFRQTQGARISRWIRDSEAGWLFYGPGGTPFHILSDEAARLEAEGNAIVKRLVGPGFVALPPQGAIIAALIGVPLLLGWVPAFAHQRHRHAGGGAPDDRAAAGAQPSQ
jgi:hypothetical protein